MTKTSLCNNNRGLRQNIFRQPRNSGKSMQSLNFQPGLGPQITAEGTTFSLWAPQRMGVDLVWELGESKNRARMHRSIDGWHYLLVKENLSNAFYGFACAPSEMDDGYRVLPDPCSRFQPRGVHGMSQVVANQFEWSDAAWPGVQQRDLVIYETHVGTWTLEGTYRSATRRLKRLKDLGVTAIELLPMAQAPGRWNWGYDGVHWFAPNAHYGSPDDLRAFVDSAHQIGLAVFADVVYNHFGPEGNYLAEYGPYLSSKHSTPWGVAPNFDSDGSKFVRAWVLANAIYWLDEFHLDGLRVDAVHCTFDDLPVHILAELGGTVAEFQKNTRRKIHLIAESNVFNPEICKPVDNGGCGFTAQWCDDFLHAGYAITQPGDQRSARKYVPNQDLADVLKRGFVYTETFSKPRARVSDATKEIKPQADFSQLIFCNQNHDFVGNHPDGLRLAQLTSPDCQIAAAALLLLSPAIPMLFMGEAIQSTSPFVFFCDFEDPALRHGVVVGRKAEYPQHDWSQCLSPIDEQAFFASKLSECEHDASDLQQASFAIYQALLNVRSNWLQSGTLDGKNFEGHWLSGHGIAVLAYHSGDDTHFLISRLNSTSRAGGRCNEIDSSHDVLSVHLDAIDARLRSQVDSLRERILVGQADRECFEAWLRDTQINSLGRTD